MSVLELDAATRSEVAERRRPGRLDHVSPELVPLLRGESAFVADAPVQFGEPDQLGGARGLTLAVAISAALWAVIAYGGSWLFS